MSNLKEILDSLRPIDRSALYYAFERELTFYVQLPGNRFIGVNTDSIPTLIPDSDISRGAWRVGCVTTSLKTNSKNDF